MAEGNMAAARLARGVGANIRRWRRLRGWTQVELAERMGTNGPVISRIETGVAAPDLMTVLRLSAALDVHPSALVSPGARPVRVEPVDLQGWSTLAVDDRDVVRVLVRRLAQG